MDADARQNALREAHDRNGAHQGQTRTLSHLSKDYYWCTMMDDVKQWVCILLRSYFWEKSTFLDFTWPKYLLRVIKSLITTVRVGVAVADSTPDSWKWRTFGIGMSQSKGVPIQEIFLVVITWSCASVNVKCANDYVGQGLMNPTVRFSVQLSSI